MAYKLSAILQGHTSDVRCVASTCSNDAARARILSSSRDSTARLWERDGESSTWSTSATLAGHEGFVGAVVSTTLADGRELAVTGGNDSLMLVYELGQQHSTPPDARLQPFKTLIGHSANVCCLDAGPEGLLASGSWDTTAAIWDLNEISGSPKFVLKGSELSIWAVLILPSSSRHGSIHTLTASADQIIRLYENDKLIRTFKGHTQPVRGLTLLQDKGLFASASNDGSIRIWDYKTGHALKTLAGHDSFVYSLTCTPEGHLVSSGEDRTVRVWDKSSGDLKQVITIPAISIWSVACISGTSDIVVGSSDAQVRIFTVDSTRQASAADLKAYDDLVASSSVSATQIGDVKKSDLPSESALTTKKGKKEGEVMMVKNSVTSNVEAYQWSAANGEWINVGQVVDAVGSGRKQLYEGKEYDYVFDVDVSEGMPPLKLPFNTTQNPYEAAQLFLTRNDLPASYVDQVVQFIEKNTGGVALGGGAAAVDPYTGASSYRTSGGGGGVTAQPGAGTGGFSGDPWGNASSKASSRSNQLLPHKTPLTFAQVNVGAIQKKLFDFSKILSDQPSTATEFPMDNADTATLQATLSALTTSPTSFHLDTASVTLLEKLLEWPIAYRFPVLDLIRVIALNAPGPMAKTGILFSLLSHISPNSSASIKENETNSMLALRAVANLFAKPEGRKHLIGSAPEALETLAVLGAPEGLNKNGKVALATVALNYSVLAVEGSLQGDTVAHLLDFVASLLAEDDSEMLYRALVALGNIAYSPESSKGSLQVGTLQALKSRAQTIGKKSSESRVREVVSELEQKL